MQRRRLVVQQLEQLHGRHQLHEHHVDQQQLQQRQRRDDGRLRFVRVVDDDRQLVELHLGQQRIDVEQQRLEFVVVTHGAQSLAVLYALSIDGGTGATPTFAVVDGGQVLPILGLYPATDYDMQAIASDGAGGIARSPVTHFTTQTLPAIVDESFTVTSNGAYQPGYVLLTKLPVNPVNN